MPSTARRLTRLAPTAALLVAACDLSELRERYRDASPRERYVQGLEAAGLARTALGRDWIAVGERALARPVEAPLPFREAGFFPGGEAGAAAFLLRPRRGERLRVRVEAQADSGTRLFADLMELAPTRDSVSARHLVATTDSLGAAFDVVADRPVAYLLRLQPELLRPLRYVVTVQAEASVAFPVTGRDSRAVQSRWGAPRDGGARDHQGIDIFAPRGTPVVAGVDGVARVRETAIGGRVVWVRDGRRAQSLYYAHLDRQAVRDGDAVRAGDTLGFVGNTGNARTTPPHLHFGIYRRGEGAVDPFPFVDTRRAPVPALGGDTALLGRVVRVSAPGAPLRAGAAAGAAALRTVPGFTVAVVDGAAAGWVRLRLPDQSVGYVPARAVERLDRPIARERLAAASSLRVRPEPQAPPVRVTGAAAEAPVLGRFGGYVLVELDGQRGWVGEGAGR
jgi:peptidoglycan LD-endopeptidase LytH